MAFIETYRGTVNRWEVDNVDHFTVAFYFARLEDATAGLLDAIGLGRDILTESGRAMSIAACRVRYLKELRVGDILHIRSGVIGIDDDSLTIGHEVHDSGEGRLCTTVEQRMRLVKAGTQDPLRFGPETKSAVAPLRVDWESEPAPPPQHPPVDDDTGFIDTARDVVKPWEVDAFGLAVISAYIHRFSSANAHVLAAFGLTPAYLREKGRGLSTFEFRLAFTGMLREGDVARVRSGLLHIGNSSMRILHRMTNGRTGALVSTLEQAGVHLDMAARRPDPITDAHRARARGILLPKS